MEIIRINAICLIIIFVCILFPVSCANMTDTTLYPILLKGKWGFMDRNGKVVIKPEHDECFLFYNGLSAVYKYSKEGYRNQKAGFIDTTGKIVVEIKYDIAIDFHENIGMLKLNDKIAYIDTKGNFITDFIFKDGSWFHEGLALVVNEQRLGGFINTKGELIIPYEFDGEIIANVSMSTYPGYGFSEGLVYVYKDSKYGYIDKTGNMLIQPSYDGCGSFENGYAIVQINGKYGLIDKKGNYIIKPIYEYLSIAAKIERGLIMIFTEGKIFGLINHKGEIIVKPTYNHLNAFSEGLAAVSIKDEQNNSKWGYIDMTGKIVIPPHFIEVRDFSEGLASVSISGQGDGYIDKKGNMIIKPQFYRTYYFKGGLACVYIDIGSGKPDGKYGYIDKTGKYVWEPTN